MNDTGFLARGVVSAGVQQKYCGMPGRTGALQDRGFAAYAFGRERAPVDRELYPPRSRTNDPDRPEAARIPAERGFATKGELARTLILRAPASPLPIAWVTAGCPYVSDVPGVCQEEASGDVTPWSAS
ncbi:transposase [Streptomyces sp. NPDC051642]|uniref:transposase n=1 Tax=Streptomyces sp. NPDC051642 TaxID=3154646 RepID=UPI00344A5CB7